MGKAEEINKKFGTSQSEYDRIIKEIESIAHVCKTLNWHEEISNELGKKLKKEGFKIEYENGYYIIKW